MDTEQVKVDGPIAVRGPNNYALDTQDAVVDLKTRQLQSTGAVTGTVRQGTFSANSMRADLESRTPAMRHAAFLILALAAAAPATAQTRHDTNAPVNVAADHIELQDRANRAVFAGNVQVQQAEMTLRAKRIVLTYT
ncbi:hypothetical protein LTR94_032766, partial [Friedmanniomyces endolithicus]